MKPDKEKNKGGMQGSQDNLSDRSQARDRQDLPDSREDQRRMEPEEGYIELPDVKDIPGQEFIHVPPLGELADTTISSADEEGDRIFEQDDTDLERGNDDAGVSENEKSVLSDSGPAPDRDEEQLRQARMDDRDFEGAALNEKGFGEERSGRDLDIPGGEMDDQDEEIGEEDEENNYYSLGGDTHSRDEERS